MKTWDNYIQNAKLSGDRTLKIELSGRVNQNEKNFLSGISYFTASTIGKDNDKHLNYVSGIMVRLIKHLENSKSPAR